MEDSEVDTTTMDEPEANMVENGGPDMEENGDLDIVETGDLDTALSHDEASQANILIIGKTGAGKASIANAILDSDVFHVGTAIQSTTRDCNETIPVEKHSAGGYNYKIALVDTVGVKDDQQVEQHKKRIREALTNFDYLNMIILVLKFDRFSAEETKLFQEVISILNSRLVTDTSSITALVITGCEQKDTTARNGIWSSLESNDKTSQVVQFARKGTVLVGLPKISEVLQQFKQLIEQRKNSDKQQLQQLAKHCQAEKSEIIPPAENSTRRKYYCQGCIVQ